MKYLIIIIIISICLKINASTQIIDIIAIINNEPITTLDIKQSLLIQLFNNKTKHFLINNSNILKNIIDKKILEKIKIQYAKELNIKIKKKHIKNTIIFITKNNNLSYKNFKKELKKNYIKYNEYYNFIKNELIIKQLENKEITNKINIKTNNSNKLINLNSKITKYYNNIFYIETVIIKNNYKSIQNSYKKLLSIYINKKYNINSIKIKTINTKKNIKIKNNLIKQLYIKNIHKTLIKLIHLNSNSQKNTPFKNNNHIYIQNFKKNYENLKNNFYINTKSIFISKKYKYNKILFINNNIKNKNSFFKQKLLFSNNTNLNINKYYTWIKKNIK